MVHAVIFEASRDGFILRDTLLGGHNSVPAPSFAQNLVVN